MAKQSSNKQSVKANEIPDTKPDAVAESTTAKNTASSTTESATTESSTADRTPATDSKRTPAAPKESPAATRPKKTKSPVAKQSSLMPSEQKLENLAAAIAAAGNADNLLLILHHVEAAGGQTEVIESIEAYRALKTAVEQGAGSH